MIMSRSTGGWSCIVVFLCIFSVVLFCVGVCGGSIADCLVGGELKLGKEMLC